MRWVKHVAQMWDIGNAYILLKNSKHKTQRTPKHKWVDNIIIELKETGCEFVDSIHLVRDRAQW